jgi:uncharacterized protein YkwD
MRTNLFFGKFILLLALLAFQNNYGQFTAEEQEMLRLVNNFRVENGLSTVRLNQNLNKAAFNHSKDMADNNYFDHVGLNGSTFSQRLKNAGYVGSPHSENIAAGNAAVLATFNQWKNSTTGHRENILNKNSNEMGIGHATKSGSEFTHYWTQVFGKGSAVLSTSQSVIDDNVGLKVYPNPAQDMIYLDFNKKIQVSLSITITNITGQIVYQKNVDYSNDVFSINISNLSNGIYLLKTQNGISHKIVKQ